MTEQATGLTPRRFPMLPYWIVLGLLFIVANFPIGTWIYGLYEVSAYDCTINASADSSCAVGGVAQAQEAAGLSLSYLFLLATWPFAFLLGIVWLTVLLIHRALWKRKAVA